MRSIKQGIQTVTLILLLSLASLIPTGAHAGSGGDTYQGVPVGFTSEGYPYMGQVDAPVVIEEWSDYLCPFCRRHFQVTFPDLRDKYILTGQVKLVFRDFPLTGLHATAPAGHVAATCAGQQSPSAYWSMHDALFARQAEWNRQSDASEFFHELALGLNLDLEVFDACRASPGVSASVAASVQKGSGYDLTGTPSFRFFGVDKTAYPLIGALPFARFEAYANALVKGDAPPQPKKPPPPELPAWAKAEGLAPDHTRPGFTVAGDQYRGNPGAKVVVIEFFDYQCPACKSHALTVQPDVDRALVDTGDVMWVFKNLPLKDHPQSAIAASASECASDQGAFESYHRQLFEQSERWTNSDAPRQLSAMASELGLNEENFDACFHGRESMERVLEDIYDAQGVIKSTPSFVVLSGGKGEKTGPLGAEQFIETLKERLSADILVVGDSSAE